MATTNDVGATAEPAQRQFTADEVGEAVNKAADDVLELSGASHADAINLVVNATMSYLRGEASSLTEVAELNYSDAPDEVLSWA